MHWPTRQSRSSRTGTLVIWLLWSWMVMTLSHELGHVLAGWLGGGQLRQLELLPWHLPYSLIVGDRHPLITLWAGPFLGSLVPLIAAGAVRRPGTWFVAWFCVVANASYLLLGYFTGDPELDSARMIQHGTRPWHLLTAVALALPPGYWKLRRMCIDLMSGATKPMSAAALRTSGCALVVAVTVQAIIAITIQRALGM